MAFFEDLGNNIKSMGNSLSNGAKDITQKAQLNNEIGKIKKDIDIFYTQLGEATYKNLTAEEDAKVDVQPIIDNLNGAFAAVKDKEDAIARIEAEAQARREEEEERRRKEAEERARAAMAGTCQVCGAQLLPDSKFCVQCGSPVQKPEENPAAASADLHKCPNCGAPYDEFAKFCVQCGTKLQ